MQVAVAIILSVCIGHVWARVFVPTRLFYTRELSTLVALSSEICDVPLSCQRQDNQSLVRDVNLKYTCKCACDMTCVLRKDCCLDSEHTAMLTTYLPLDMEDCSSNPDGTKSYRIVSRCLAGAGSERKDACAASDTYMDTIWVMHKESGSIYKNMACAECNEVQPDKLVPWMPSSRTDNGYDSEMGGNQSPATQTTTTALPLSTPGNMLRFNRGVGRKRRDLGIETPTDDFSTPVESQSKQDLDTTSESGVPLRSSTTPIPDILSGHTSSTTPNTSLTTGYQTSTNRESENILEQVTSDMPDDAIDSGFNDELNSGFNDGDLTGGSNGGFNDGLSGGSNRGLTGGFGTLTTPAIEIDPLIKSLTFDSLLLKLNEHWNLSIAVMDDLYDILMTLDNFTVPSDEPFILQPPGAIVPCYKDCTKQLINSCNASLNGIIDEYDLLVKACDYFNNPVFETQGGLVYSNVFCYICNGSPGTIDGAMSSTTVVPPQDGDAQGLSVGSIGSHTDIVKIILMTLCALEISERWF